ncbi:MAG: HicB family protein [Azospira oryzae]|nr:MAG: HicB family protein [Azospira oryzae]PZP80789.1 MAG: HicB family protein [Azospira oryzae]
MARLTLEYWQDEGWFVGRLREVPGCFSQGETLEALERNIAEVYQLLHEESDLPVPENVLTKAIDIAA